VDLCKECPDAAIDAFVKLSGRGHIDAWMTSGRFGTSCSSARIRGKISPACPNRVISERAGSTGTGLELPCDSPSRPPGSHERSLPENETCSAGHRTVLAAPLIAEYLLGNLPITMLGALVVLAPMYGGGAILIRETVRRAGLGCRVSSSSPLRTEFWKRDLSRKAFSIRTI